MAVKKQIKKDFSKDQMYAKIMPSMINAQPVLEDEEQIDKSDAPSSTVTVSVASRYILRNYMEDIVIEKLRHTMQMLKACSCEKCQKDVMAAALNNLPPAYMTIESENLPDAVKQLRAGMDIKVSAALIKAVQDVKANPQH